MQGDQPTRTGMTGTDRRDRVGRSRHLGLSPLLSQLLQQAPNGLVESLE